MKDDTDWIKPDTPVVVYQDSHRGRLNPRLTTIARVAKQSFTVDGIEERFKIAEQRTKNLGSTWSGWTYRCVPADSDEAKDVQHKQRGRLLEYKAREACEIWCRNRTEENRVAAIEALTKLGGFEPRPSEEGA